MSLKDSPNCTSSQAADSGPLQLDLLGGPMIDRSGLEAARANPSARPASKPDQMIQGICGQTFIASSVPDGPLKSWENRLRERLGMVGSTESLLIWREKTTPAGRSISRLAPWTAPKSETDSTGSLWPTPEAGAFGAKDVTRILERRQECAERHGNNGFGLTLGQQIAIESEPAMWPTPDTGQGGGSGRSGDRIDEVCSVQGMMRVNAEGSTWSTPRASDGEKGGPNMSFGAGGTPLPAQMHQSATWAAPRAAAGKALGDAKHLGGRRGAGNIEDQMRASGEITTWATVTTRDHKGSRSPNGSRELRPGGQMLNEQIVETADAMARWPAPKEADHRPGMPERYQGTQSLNGRRSNLNDALTDITVRTGPPQSGSTAMTKKRGVPNPLFPFWLMGFPAEWISGALRAMQSMSSSRRK